MVYENICPRRGCFLLPLLLYLFFSSFFPTFIIIIARRLPYLRVLIRCGAQIGMEMQRRAIPLSYMPAAGSTASSTVVAGTASTPGGSMIATDGGNAAANSKTWAERERERSRLSRLF